MIAAIGLCTLDHIMVVDSFKATEGTYKSESYHVDGGGMAATAMCTASRLGSDTRLISRIGDDVNGSMIVQGLHDFGINCEAITTIPGVNSIVCVTLVERDSGQKQFYTEREWQLYNTDPEFEPEVLDGAQVLLIDGHGGEIIAQGVQWAKAQQVPVVADWKRRYENFESIVPYVDYLIIPDFFARDLTNARSDDDMLGDLHTLCNGVVVVTQGSRGGMYLQNGIPGRYPAFSVDVVDTTGAGDAFHGAFCHYLAQGADLDQCLMFASAAGALNCRDIGGRRALPVHGEVRRLVDQSG